MTTSNQSGTNASGTNASQEIAGEATEVSVPTDLRHSDAEEKETPLPNVSLPEPVYKITAADGAPEDGVPEDDDT